MVTREKAHENLYLPGLIMHVIKRVEADQIRAVSYFGIRKEDTNCVRYAFAICQIMSSYLGMDKLFNQITCLRSISQGGRWCLIDEERDLGVL